MAGKRRTAEGLAPVPRAYIEKLIEKAQGLRVKAMIALLYLTGRRIGEVLRLKHQGFKTQTYMGREILYVHVQLEKKGTKKHPKPPQFADIPILMSDSMVKHIFTWLNYQKKHARGMFEKHLFGFGSRQRAWQILTALDRNIWVHWFRHMRASHLAERMDPFELREFFRFESLDPAVSYVHKKEVISKIEEADKLQRLGA